MVVGIREVHCIHCKGEGAAFCNNPGSGHPYKISPTCCPQEQAVNTSLPFFPVCRREGSAQLKLLTLK